MSAPRGPWYYRLARSIALRVIPQPTPPISWQGDFADWAGARSACAGYSEDAIVARAVAAAREVVAGRAAFDRDGVAFAEREYAWPMLASLLYVAATRGSLHVVDVGGSLGSTYRQHLPVLPDTIDLHWHVVEQEPIARVGAAEFTTPDLTFSSSLADGDLASADVALFGSSLCYLEDPGAFLDALADAEVGFLLIDRTPFLVEDDGRHHVAAQIVRGEDGAVRESYPCWIFSRSALERDLAESWEMVGDWWVSDLQPVPDPIHLGSLWRRR